MADETDMQAVIARIREEARRPEYQVAEPEPLAPMPALVQQASVPDPTHAVPSAAPSPPPAAPVPTAAPADSLNGMLLVPGDDEFMRQAYERMLHRAPDAAGLQYYGERLREGYGRTFVLCALHAAREPGRPRGKLRNLGLAPLVYNQWRILRRLGLGALGAIFVRYYDGWRQLRLVASQEFRNWRESRADSAALTAILDESLARGAALTRRVEELSRELTAVQDGQREHSAQQTRALESLHELQTAQVARTDDRIGQAESGLGRTAEELAALDGRFTALERETSERLAGQLGTARRELAILRAAFQAQRLQWQETLAGTTAPEDEGSARATDGIRRRGALEAKIDAYYTAFEAQFRGSEREIRDVQTHYLDTLAELPARLQGKPVIDLGSGRGEWLALLREAGFAGSGIDASATLAAHCRAQGLQVEQDDVVAALRRRGDASAGAISGFHIVEHLPFEVLYQTLEEAFRVIAPGGALLLETPNPENVLVGSHTFYNDFSHLRPVTPTALEFLVTYLGFSDVRILRLHPYGEEAYIDEQTLAAQRLNGHLYGPQDFALIARRPETGPDEVDGGAEAKLSAAEAGAAGESSES